ncbi:biotin--[acetyl-CoA-carboxylase] ligase [Alienimonas californiensis]|uniref:Bifunctional ligase/repressor BirA n=1 Tax=Alienimonas californiensis TaxID=2527989 RepID=A0A517PC47_9PLAN|nr:biotin--[acetyl-CoA-carboxylase] ligase [Alienimonas californiensis]QDT16955.1 Bifunctional ligase/repressor BirA [Alienimonas californiensis]
MSFPPDAAARLRSETFVRSVELHAELGSTNDRALELAADADATLPVLVLAERQTGGRGRGANRWAAPPGCLTFTLLLRPPEGLPDAALLAPVAGLAVAETAAGLTDAEVGVKWPNDVLLRPAPPVPGVEVPWGKLAGVLCERPRLDRVAVGVGLNLNCDPAAFPSHLPRPAATLRGERGPHDALAVLIDLLVRLEAAFTDLAEGGRLDPTLWAARDVLAGRAVSVAAGAAKVSGTACGVTADGALRVFDGQAAREIRSGTVDW